MKIAIQHFFSVQTYWKWHIKECHKEVKWELRFAYCIWLFPHYAPVRTRTMKWDRGLCLPRTQTSLFWWNCARKGRREGDNERDVASPAVCTLPMVPCGSSPVTCFALASAMRKTKRLRRRLGLCARPNKSLFLVNPSQEQVPSVHPNGTTETVYKARTWKKTCFLRLWGVYLRNEREKVFLNYGKMNLWQSVRVLRSAGIAEMELIKCSFC